MPREIHTLSGDLYQPPSASLAATRWTSNSGRWSARAPFGGRGMGGLGCACQKKQSGLAGCGCDLELGDATPYLDKVNASQTLVWISKPGHIARLDKKGQEAQLELSCYLLSYGKLEPTRTIKAMVTALRGLGYAVNTAPAVKSYPLTWVWGYNAPEQNYQSRLVTGSAKPIEAAYEEVGVLKTVGVPTMQDSAKLPSFGTSVTLSRIRPPANADLQPLLDAVDKEMVRARSNSNLFTAQETFIKVTPGRGAPDPAPTPTEPPDASGSGWGWGLALAAGLFLLSQKDKEQIRV